MHKFAGLNSNRNPLEMIHKQKYPNNKITNLIANSIYLKCLWFVSVHFRWLKSPLDRAIQSCLLSRQQAFIFICIAKSTFTAQSSTRHFCLRLLVVDAQMLLCFRLVLIYSPLRSFQRLPLSSFLTSVWAIEIRNCVRKFGKLVEKEWKNKKRNKKGKKNRLVKCKYKKKKCKQNQILWKLNLCG